MQEENNEGISNKNSIASQQARQELITNLMEVIEEESAFVIFHADEKYYVQYGIDENNVLAELVSNDFLPESFQLSKFAVEKIKDFGWKVKAGENYQKIWKFGSVEEMVAESIHILDHIYEVEFSPPFNFTVDPPSRSETKGGDGAGCSLFVLLPLNTWAVYDGFGFIQAFLNRDLDSFWLQFLRAFFLLFVGVVASSERPLFRFLWKLLLAIGVFGFGYSIYNSDDNNYETVITFSGLFFLLLVAASMPGMSVEEQECSESRNASDVKIDEKNLIKKKASDFLSQKFQVQPCTRCFESQMYYLSVSKEGNSIQYQCAGCKKKYYGAALSEEAKRSVHEVVRSAYSAMGWSGKIQFAVQDATLPYQQTSRVHLTESVRSEVWRRDMGKCTSCGSRENLEFDHIIPVSKGGANSVRNLQLLCRSCNASKSNKI